MTFGAARPRYPPGSGPVRQEAAEARPIDGLAAERHAVSGDGREPPILAQKHHRSPSAFTPENLLRGARRQNGAALAPVHAVCVLDPDSDIVRRLSADGRARRHDGWVCYRAELNVFDEAGLTIGIVGCAVGAPFAVLVAEELFASGCELPIRVTSSGQIAPLRELPYFILIDRALRDECTSYYYLPPADWSEAPADLPDRLDGAFTDTGAADLRGPVWTTDAPFRETAAAIEVMRRRGFLAVIACTARWLRP